MCTVFVVNSPSTSLASSKMNVEVPSSNISSGVDVEKKSFTWSIGNYPVLRRHTHMIDSQGFPFTAGETTGHPSQWIVRLKETKKDEKRWIGIYLLLKSPKPTDAAFQASYYQIRWTIKNKQGKIIKDLDSGQSHIVPLLPECSLRGLKEFIDADDANWWSEESLVIQITFKLYTPSRIKSTTCSLEATTKKFQGTFLEQLRKDLAGLLEIPEACKDIKIISKDEEFSMKKGILSVRSEVFAAMLGADMAEANSGVIKLSYLSSKALKVFLEFLKTGVLLPEWSEAGVILELTNAAAEYQLKDLLQFLDEAMGKVCQLENVLDLAVLARQLSLKVAEEELMMFVRKEGVITLDNLFQMWNTEVPGIDSEATPGAAANKRKKRKKHQR